jgi:GrpB-like predicted nucleotidyltransferase (UPF0157 family)
MNFDINGHGRVELHPYDPRWPQIAADELSRLREAVGENLIQGEHIGSTSIPGIAAKPIIDLMPLVRSLSILDESRRALESLGYEWRGEFGIPGRRFCLRVCTVTGSRLTNVHFFEVDAPDVLRHLAFRDYLKAHPAEKTEYEVVKRRAAEQCPLNVFDYNDAKSDWIKACEKRAIAWHQTLREPG